MNEKAIVKKQDFIDAALLLRQYAALLNNMRSQNPDQGRALEVALVFEAQLHHPTRIG